MTEPTKNANGYLTVSNYINEALNKAYTEGVSLDEAFAALKVQCEVTNIKLAQAVVYQQQQEAYAQQQAAAQAVMEAPVEATEGEANADA